MSDISNPDQLIAEVQKYITLDGYVEDRAIDLVNEYVMKKNREALRAEAEIIKSFTEGNDLNNKPIWDDYLKSDFNAAIDRVYNYLWSK